MIENNKLATKEDIVSAYETIYQKISQLENGNNSKMLENLNEKSLHSSSERLDSSDI